MISISTEQAADMIIIKLAIGGQRHDKLVFVLIVVDIVFINSDMTIFTVRSGTVEFRMLRTNVRQK